MKNTIEWILVILALMGMFIGLIIIGVVSLQLLFDFINILMQPTMDIVYFLSFLGLIGFVSWSAYYLNKN